MLEGNEEHSMEDVAASLLVKPAESKPDSKVVASKLENVQTESEASDEDTSDTEAFDNNGSEKEKDEAFTDEQSSDSEADDEEDVDIDELEIEVPVDGKEEKVKLKDLKASYSGNKAIDKRLQEATEARTYAAKTAQTLHTALTEQAARLAKLDEILQKVAEPEINWEELKRTNLPRYLLERDKQREAQEKRATLSKEQERVAKEREYIEARAREEYTATQARALVAKAPEFADPAKAQETLNKLVKTGEIYGYTPAEVSSVMDHRAMLVLRDAMKYHESMAKQAEAQKKTAPSTALLRPSASKATRPASQAKKLQEGLLKRARATGKVEDIAATLLVRKK